LPGAVQVSRWLAGWEDDPDEVRDQALRVRMAWRIERMACTLHVEDDPVFAGMHDASALVAGAPPGSCSAAVVMVAASGTPGTFPRSRAEFTGTSTRRTWT
jgi:hypothetical protein